MSKYIQIMSPREIDLDENENGFESLLDCLLGKSTYVPISCGWMIKDQFCNFQVFPGK